MACLQFVLVLLVVAASFADDQIDKANNYIDDFIETSTSESGGFPDVMNLTDMGQEFEREIGFVKVKAEAKLYDGKIEGLSTLKRKGNTTVFDLDDLLLVTAQMSFQKIQASYKGRLQINNKGPKINLNARIGYSEVTMVIVAPVEGGNATLVSFNINRLSKIRVNVQGLGPMGWSASIFANMVLNAFDKVIAKAASAKIANYFSEEIAKVPYPA